MIIKPIIQGVVARSAHPSGCAAAVQSQIDAIKARSYLPNKRKRVLIIGASSGFGLAARIATTFGLSNADTIGVSFERGPSENSVGSAGWYNNVHFKRQAEASDHIAVNIVGDAFSSQVRQQVIEAIETYFEGEVDLVVYSLASGMRPKPDGSGTWKSTIKTIGKAVNGATIVLENDQWRQAQITPATPQEIDDTVKVMGGEDWEQWIDTLINSDSIAQGCQTVAFSYIGSELTYPIYHQGTLGRAKVDLHQTSHTLNLKLANFSGGAYACVCKALVTKASVFIPAFTPYILALYRVMKQRGTHEGCIEQMDRLFNGKLLETPVPVDAERLLRLDEYELDPSVQQRVGQLMKEMNADNFKRLGDYQGYKSDFMRLNGFDIEGIDYDEAIDLTELTTYQP